MKRVIIGFFMIILVFMNSSAPVYSQDSDEQKEMVALLTIGEAALASAAAIYDRYGSIESLEFEGKYSDRDWIMRMIVDMGDGELWNIGVGGFIWDYYDWSVNYNGWGILRGEPVTINGNAYWMYDERTNSFRYMDFDQVVKVGENSWWWWIVGGEVVAGIASGVTVSVLGAPVVSPPAAAAAGVITGATAANQLVTLSKTIRETLDADEPPDPPERPERPEAPENTDDLDLTPQEDLLVVSVIRDESQIEGHGPLNDLRLSGNFSIEEKSFNGEVSLEK